MVVYTQTEVVFKTCPFEFCCFRATNGDQRTTVRKLQHCHDDNDDTACDAAARIYTVHPATRKADVTQDDNEA